MEVINYPCLGSVLSQIECGVLKLVAICYITIVSCGPSRTWCNWLVEKDLISVGNKLCLAFIYQRENIMGWYTLALYNGTHNWFLLLSNTLYFDSHYLQFIIEISKHCQIAIHCAGIQACTAQTHCWHVQNIFARGLRLVYFVVRRHRSISPTSFRFTSHVHTISQCKWSNPVGYLLHIIAVPNKMIFNNTKQRATNYVYIW